MKIGFLLGWPEISGGSYVVYEHASRLRDLGHDVAIITEEQVNPERYFWHPAADTLVWQTLLAAENTHFDVIIATWWESPFFLHRLEANQYVYFVQSIESRFWDEADLKNHNTRDNDFGKRLCESTYSFNIPMITEAGWIKDYLLNNYNQQVFLVRNGIRKDIYTPDGPTISPRIENRFRVLVEGPIDVAYKNVPNAIKLCKRAEVDEVWLLTSSEITTFPGVDRVFSNIPIHDTPEIYRSCDVLLKLSYIEGMFGPPLEMFHCGGTAIVYDVTGHDEYIIHNKNSYVVKKKDDKQIVAYLRKLKEEPLELERLQMAALDTAESWIDWDDSVRLFEKVLLQIHSNPPQSRIYIKKYAKQLQRRNNDRVNNRDMRLFQEREIDLKDSSTDNFVQLYYWAEKDGLSIENFSWANYQCGQQVEIKMDIPITGFPFWIRVDPSVRLGVISIDSITVTNLREETMLMSFKSPEQFDELYAGGTMRRIKGCAKGVFFSHGNDPQLILPALETGRVGDRLELTIRLTEQGIREFIDTFGGESCTTEDAGTMPLSGRFLTKFFKKTNN